MGPLASLAILSISMGVSTFLFGMLPLTLRLSRLTLRLLEVGGAGLLLGAACSVVLPEGAGTTFREEGGAGGEDHHSGGHVHSKMGLAGVEPENLLAVSFLTGALVMFVIDQIMAPGSHSHDYQPGDEEHSAPGSAISSSSQHASRRRSHSGAHQHPTHNPTRPIHRLTRPESLVLMRSSSAIAAKGLEEAMKQNFGHGLSRFDGLPVSPTDTSASGQTLDSVNRSAFGTTDRSPPPSPRRRSSRTGRGGSSHSGSGSGGAGGGLGLSPSRGLRRAFTSIAGLIIHAACDGIAMGASSASKDEGLKLVVVGAIMIHKAPAAFGLCSLLLSQRLSRSDIRRAMGIFSLATPVGALTTYMLLSVFFSTEPSPSSASLTSAPAFTAAQEASGNGGGGGGGGISAKHVGTALTFSAGSFIFVALDAVHELASHSADVHTVHLPIGSIAGGGGGAGASQQGDGGEVGEESADELEDGDERRSGVRTTIAVERQTLGRTGRILVLLVGAILPRSLQMLFGHGH